MAISLKDLKRVKSVLPPRCLIYSPPGMGKTTLANEFPNAVFLQTEQGEGTDELNTFGLLTSYEQIVEAIGALYQEDHSYQTVVLDSADKTEPLIWAATCAANNWQNIEAPGYGKGYLAADQFWRDLIEGLNALRRDRAMNIVVLGHSEIERFDDPRSASYSRFDVRLHKRGQAIIEDEVDFIGFINQEATIKEEDAGFNKKRAHAEGGVQRWIYTEGRPSMNAKNRYNMPPRILFTKGNGYNELAKHFPNSGVSTDQPEQNAAAAESKPTTNGKTRKAA